MVTFYILHNMVFQGWYWTCYIPCQLAGQSSQSLHGKWNIRVWKWSDNKKICTYLLLVLMLLCKPNIVKRIDQLDQSLSYYVLSWNLVFPPTLCRIVWEAYHLLPAMFYPWGHITQDTAGKVCNFLYWSHRQAVLVAFSSHLLFSHITFLRQRFLK